MEDLIKIWRAMRWNERDSFLKAVSTAYGIEEDLKIPNDKSDIKEVRKIYQQLVAD